MGNQNNGLFGWLGLSETGGGGVIWIALLCYLVYRGMWLWAALLVYYLSGKTSSSSSTKSSGAFRGSGSSGSW